MKFVCLGYMDWAKFESVPEDERDEMFHQAVQYDDGLRRSGHVTGGEALQGPDTAATVRWNNGKALVTDGPFAETKEQLGGIFILEARDQKHAIELVSQHPGVRFGPIEVRPAEDFAEMVRRNEERRKKA